MNINICKLHPAEQQAATKAAPSGPDYSEKWDAELGRTAMRFVDRAGDVHPGIDDAETICAEFHKAMLEVIERMPHVQRMAAPRQEAQEPVAWLSPWRADQVTTDYDAYGERGIPLYTAPQPAPDCHHRPPCNECAALAAQGGQHE